MPLLEYAASSRTDLISHHVSAAQKDETRRWDDCGSQRTALVRNGMVVYSVRKFCVARSSFR